ncbi:restriction endonuclease subunit S [Flavobacterium sp. RSSA_27]|uniref:restriction endonuclease subunit S n=1 Tax=Flavobacterium sp. RSSA_27 TaxID=3447667 RepID=UPI003F3D08AC
MKQGYKESELGLIPVDWVVKRIKDVLDFFPTASYSRADLSVDGEAQYLHYGDIHTKFDFYLRINSKNLPNISLDKLRNYKTLKVGDLVMTDASEDYDGIGKAVEILEVSENKVIPGLHTFLLRDKEDNFSLGFKGYLTVSDAVKKQFQRIAVGTKVYSLSKTSLQNLKIPLPPLPEQKAIADCLATWDKAIESQTLLIKAKETRKKALMQQLLTGKKRLPGFTEEWKEVKLGDLFSERNEVKIADLPLLSIGQEGVYPQTDSNKRDISNADKSKYKRIIPGDIGYNTMRMWQGRSALSSLEGIVSPAYTILKPKENVNSYYFSILFKTSKLTNLFWRNSQGLVDDTLNCKYKDFSKIKYRVPSFEEQNAIATILSTTEKEIQIENQKLVALQEQKKGMMQQLLTGKVRLV